MFTHQSLDNNIDLRRFLDNMNSQSLDNNNINSINLLSLDNNINPQSSDNNINRLFFVESHINPRLLINNINPLSLDSNINTPLLDNNQISYSSLFYTDASIYNIDLNQLCSPHHINLSTNINNNQTPYLQQLEPISQLPNYPDLYTYPSNEQPVYTTSQPELKSDAPSITTNIQPNKDKKPRKKPRKKTEPYIKRTHARIACNLCRKNRLRCEEKKEGSSSCNRCIGENVQCILDENPGKRGCKLNSKNKPKEIRTENRDINTADSVEVTKPCCHGNNGAISDNLDLKGTSSILSPKIRQTQADVDVDTHVNNNFNGTSLVSDDGSGDDLQGGNCLQQLENGYALPTSTYNHQANDQQRSNIYFLHWGEHVAEFTQEFGIVIDRKNENKTENRDNNSADNTVEVIKQCRHGNNEVVADNLNLEVNVVDTSVPNRKSNFLRIFENQFIQGYSNIYNLFRNYFGYS
nr:8195_t:CDS:2 [Entrophospora candida]